MSAYPSDQRCPRCQYPVAPGATVCANCGLALTGAQGAAPGSQPAYPSTPPASGGSYGTMPSADPYGGPATPGGQPPTLYGGSGTMNSAPTVLSSFPPQGSGGQPGSQPSYPPPPPSYPGSQPQGGYGSTPAYPNMPTAYAGSQPQGGYGSAPAYPGSQPQGAYGSAPAYPGGTQPQGAYGSAPAYPGSQPQGSVPGGFSAPPAVAPQPTQKKGNGLKIAIIAIVILVILGAGGGTAAYLLTRPKPTITVGSDYKVGSTPAGAAGTVFHFTGTDFSSNSAITFLLDGNPAPDVSTAQSDNSGNVKADLKVTANWPTGNHTLSAKDASGYAPQSGFAVTIVSPGQANTPGPNGAPADDTPSFTVNATVSPSDAVTGEQLQSFNDTLVVTGKPDPAGGTVCDPKNDSGQPITQTGTTSSGVSFTVTYLANCSGTYKSGQLTYTETATSYQIAFGNGVNCRANVPFVNQDLTGSFTDPTTISGTYKADAITINCSNGQSIQTNPEKGTWTGTKG